MKLLIKKEWKLTVTPVPLLFLLLSALVLVPSYPYYVTFFYNALGIFLMLQAARENRDVYYMALLPLTKRDLVRARFFDHRDAPAPAGARLRSVHAPPQGLCGDQ